MSSIKFKFAEDSLSRDELNSLLQASLFIQNRFKGIDLDITISDEEVDPAYVSITVTASHWLGTEGYISTLKIMSSVPDLEIHVDAIFQAMSSERDHVLEQILEINDRLPNKLSAEQLEAYRNVLDKQFPVAS